MSITNYNPVLHSNRQKQRRDDKPTVGMPAKTTGLLISVGTPARVLLTIELPTSPCLQVLAHKGFWLRLSCTVAASTNHCKRMLVVKKKLIQKLQIKS